MSDNASLIDMLRTELRAGFRDVSERIDETNRRLSETNQRLDQTNQRLDQTNQRLDQTNQRLELNTAEIASHGEILRSMKGVMDLTLVRLEDFQIDVSRRFDGVGSYLRSINGTLRKHGERLDSHDARLTKLEAERENQSDAQ